jgi:hypothetical protein
MFSGILIFVIVIIFLVVLIFYKRDIVIKLFSLDFASSANQFQARIEETADLVIERLEKQIIHLEELLVEADMKIKNLDDKIRATNIIIIEQNKDIAELEKQDNLVILDNAKNEKNEKIDTHSNNKGTITVQRDEYNILSLEAYKEMEPSERRIHILVMADQGYSSIEIAKITGISKSEIVLLLQLNKK